MHKSPKPIIPLLLVAIVCFILSSCNNNVAEIPFPQSDSGFPQPATTALKIGEPRKIEWITVKAGVIKPTVKKVDVKNLPSVPYDADGFNSFSKPPEEAHFDFNAVPEHPFTPEKVASQNIKYKTYVLGPPAITKTVPIAPRAGTPLSIFDIGRLQGLPTRNVFALFKDSRGAIWIGADLGLFRFDGENMQTYGSLVKGAVGAIIEDNKGRIWYLRRRGIGWIDTKLGIQGYSTDFTCAFPGFPTLMKDDKGNIWITQITGKAVVMINPDSLSYKQLNKGSGITGSDHWIHQDKKRQIWLTSNTGIDLINPAGDKIKHFDKTSGLSNDTLQAITSDAQGKIWVAVANGGVNSIDIEKGSVKHYGSTQGIHNVKTFSMLLDNKDRLWMATINSFAILDTRRDKVKYANSNEGITEDAVLGLVKDDRNRIWLANSVTGLYIIDQNADIVNPLEKKQIVSLFEDTDGNIWSGTNEGIWILDNEKKQMKRLHKGDGLGDNFVQSFVQTGKKLWVTTNGGFDLIDPVRNTIEHTGKNEGLISDTVYAIVKDYKGNTWLAGPSEGLQVYDSVKKVVLQLSTENGLADDNVSDVTVDSDGNIWVATARGGVDIIDKDLTSIRNLNNAPGLRDTSQRIVLSGIDGRMWIGSGKGLYLADTKRGTLTTIRTEEGLSNNYITSLSFYKDMIVAGTRKGVSIIKPPLAGKSPGNDTWSVSRVAKSEGLTLDNNSWDINMVTKNGKFLWGGSNGINIISDIEEEQDSALTYITGISLMGQPRYFSEPFQLAANDTLFTPDSFYVKGQSPANSGYASQKEFSWDSISAQYNLPVNFRIPYNQNYIQFQFGQLNIGRQDNTLYSYILEGLDNKWSEPDSKTSTDNYLNLSAGNYRFKVRGKYLSGKWSKPAMISFVITPPWWKTWWAYALYFIVIAGAIWGFIQYRSAQLLRENRVLEEKVEHRTLQLQKSLEDLRSTQSQLVQSEKMASLGELTAGIAHEIQNPLNFVNNFSEVNKELLQEMKEEIDKGNLQEVKIIADDVIANEDKISQHGKRADSIVKGMLQHSRSSSGLKEPTNINTLADEYFRLAYHGLRAKDKSFNATMKSDFDEKMGEVNVIRQDLGRVILNLITNAFYAVSEKKKLEPQGYEPTVYVSTKKINGKIEIKVSDNGNGIPRKVIDKIFQPFFTTKPTGEGTGLGLSMSYDIVTKGHGGELRVETQANGEPGSNGKQNGTQFIITIPV